MPASEFDDENESSKEKLEDSEDDGGLSIFGIPIPKIPFPILSFGNYNAHLILVQYSVQTTRNLKSVLVLILILKKMKSEYLKICFLFFGQKVD